MLTVNEHQGCNNITIHRDTYPQLIVNNKTIHAIILAEHISDRNGIDRAEKELGAFNWNCLVKARSNRNYTMPSVTSFFPDISRSFVVPKLTIAGSETDENNMYQWCQGLDITSVNETYIRTSNIGDIKVTVVPKCHTTEVIIESVSQVSC